MIQNFPSEVIAGKSLLSPHPQIQNHLGDGVHVQNICFSFGGLDVLSDIHGLFPKNSMTAVVGPNGAGKTTLLKILAGLEKPKTGQICYHGYPVTPRMSYLRQSHNLDRDFPLSVEETVFLGTLPSLGWHKAADQESCEKVQRALSRVNMSKLAKASLSDLSYGQLQRVFFARFLVEDAEVLLLDEPFNFVDEGTAKIFIEILQEEQLRGKTIIVVMHDLEVARKHFENVLVLSRRLIGWGRTAEILTHERWNEALFHARS